MSFLAKGASGNILSDLLVLLCLVLQVFGETRKDEFGLPMAESTRRLGTSVYRRERRNAPTGAFYRAFYNP
jgi:hypothetical protein